MIIDFEKNPDALPNSVDVCIVGSGPAGLSLALRLHQKQPGWKIAILEGGGLQPSEFSQELYEGDSVGFLQHPLRSSRIRAFGGTSNIWSGWCNPLTAADFQCRPWIKDSGWPISYQSVAPYYLSAYEFFGVDPKGVVADSIFARHPELRELDTSRANPLLMQHSYPAMHVGQNYESIIAKANKLSLYLNANLTNISLTKDGANVGSLRVAHNDQQRSYSISASSYILACGGIENPRILLSSTDVAHSGVGNALDCVGRYFIDHLHTRNAVIQNFNGRKRARYLKKSQYGNKRVTLGITASARVQQKMELANAVAYFSNSDTDRFDTSYKQLQAAINLKEQLQSRTLNLATAKNALNAVRNLDSLILMLARKTKNSDNELRSSIKSDKGSDSENKLLTLTMYAEQVPSRSSRVKISTERDKFGVPKPILDWQLTEQDYRSMRQSTLLVASEIAKADVGRLQLHPWLAEDKGNWPKYYVSSRHHMGATRMSSNRQTGVVDTNCKVHGVSNLYVSGSSVFPTGGYANPTLTIVALSQRLADHLADHA